MAVYLKAIGAALAMILIVTGSARAQERKSLSQILLEYGEQVGIQAAKDAATEVLKDGVLSILRASLCNNSAYLSSLNQNTVGSLHCEASNEVRSAPDALARPDVVVRDTYSPHTLFQLQGKWTAGAVVQCDRRWFTWTVVNDRFYFHNQLDQEDVEKILEVGASSMITSTTLSSHGDAGARWVYNFAPDGTISSRNQKSGASYILKRCPAA